MSTGLERCDRAARTDHSAVKAYLSPAKRVHIWAKNVDEG